MSDEVQNVKERLRAGISKQLLEVIEKGEVVRNKGNVAMDEDGNPIRETASAAMIDKAMKWLEALEQRPDQDDEFTKELRRLAAESGGDFPPLAEDTEDDPATK